MAAAVEQLTVSINQISESAHDTEQYSSSAATLAASGETRVAEAANEMALIAQQTSSAAGPSARWSPAPPRSRRSPT